MMDYKSKSINSLKIKFYVINILQIHTIKIRCDLCNILLLRIDFDKCDFFNSAYMEQ